MSLCVRMSSSSVFDGRALLLFLFLLLLSLLLLLLLLLFCCCYEEMKEILYVEIQRCGYMKPFLFFIDTQTRNHWVHSGYTGVIYPPLLNKYVALWILLWAPTKIVPVRSRAGATFWPRVIALTNFKLWVSTESYSNHPHMKYWNIHMFFFSSTSK